MVDTVENAIYRMGLDGSQYAQQANVVTAANQKIISSATQLNAAEERVQQVTLQTADSFSRLEARYDPLIRAEQRRAAALAQTNRLLEEGVVDQQRYAAQVARVNAFYDGQIQRLPRLTANVNAAVGGFRRFGPALQQAGYQVGDFAVQVAAGTNPMLAFTQQASQLLGIFGPWGAVLGAAAGIVGVLAIKLLDVGEAAVTAEDRLKAFQDAVSAGNEVLKTRSQLEDLRKAEQVNEAIEKTTESLRQQEEQLKALEAAERRAAGYGPRGIGQTIGVDRTGALSRTRAEIAETQARLTALQAQLADLSNPAKLFPQDPEKARRGGVSAAEREADRLQREAAQRYDRFARELSALQARIDPVAAATAEYARAQEMLNEAYDRGLLFTEEYYKLLEKLEADFAKRAEKKPLTPKNIEQTNDLLVEQGRIGGEVASTLADGFGQVAREISAGSTNLRAFGDIGEQVLTRINDLLIQMLFVDPAQAWFTKILTPNAAPTLGSIGRGGGGVATQPAPSGGSAIGSIFSSIFGSLFGFAHGGEFDVGGNGGTDSQLVAFRATPGERVTIQPQGNVSNDNRRTSHVTNVFNFPPSPNGFGYSEQQMRQRSIERAFTQGRNV